MKTTRAPQYLMPWIPAFAAMALVACTTVPEKPQPPQFDPQAQFTTPYPSKQTTQPWWETALPADKQAEIQQVLEQNPAIRLATSTLDEARALLQQADADTGLALEASTQNKISRTNSNNSITHSTGLDASIALDLFGELSALQSAAAHTLAQRIAELADTRTQQIKSYILVFIDAAETAQHKQLLEEQIETAQTLLSLIEYRFVQGLVSSVDVLQQREQLASLQQQLPAIGLQQREQANQLAGLRGELPPAAIQLPQVFPSIVESYAFSRPYGLLEKQPALLAKQAALAAQDQTYAAALSARLPSFDISLAGLLQMASGDISRLFNAAIDASLSVFDSGKQAAEIAQQRARLSQAGIDYLQSWLNSVHTVDNLLKARVQKQQEIALAAKRATLTQQLFEASKRRYERGISDYLPVLNALRSLQQQQHEQLTLQAEQLRISVKLHSSIGL
jgi:multidrug efflux system outer membrane protein